MLSSSGYFSAKPVWITAALPLLVTVCCFILRSCCALDLECSKQGKHRVCEIKDAVPAPPFEEGDPRDRNFSSPSKKLLKRLEKSVHGNTTGANSSDEGGSRFKATIIGGGSSAQRSAVEFCMERAAENWISRIEVNVLVRFEDLGVSNLLGSAQPSRNWIVRDYICPVALAEALIGRELNNESTTQTRYEIWMTLNSEARWYTGTDAQAPFGHYDLVTVCLHETYHGLFMSGGNIGITGKDDGSYGAFFHNTRYRGRFDAFMANQDNCQIVGYESNETKLGAVLTGNNLWFARGNTKVGRLHAPRPYTVGSSLYHLSEWEYGEGTDDNDLMTPAIGSNYGQHNVGEVVLEMQKLVNDLEGNAGATECEELRDPQEDDGLIDQGSGGGNTGGGDTTGTGKDGGFMIRIGNSEVSGWIVVGGGAGAVLMVGALVGCVIRASALEKRKAAAARKERRKRRAEERINLEMGNGGGVV